MEKVGLFDKIAYAFIVISSFLLSSLRYMWILGILIALSFFIISVYFYAFTSLWCFLAALISLGFLVLLRK